MKAPKIRVAALMAAALLLSACVGPKFDSRGYPTEKYLASESSKIVNLVIDDKLDEANKELDLVEAAAKAKCDILVAMHVDPTEEDAQKFVALAKSGALGPKPNVTGYAIRKLKDGSYGVLLIAAFCGENRVSPPGAVNTGK